MDKILILFNEIFGPGGIQRYNRYLYEALTAEFKNNIFVGISLNDIRKDVSLRQGAIKIKYCGKTKLKFVKRAIFFIKAISECIGGIPKFLICTHVDLSPVALLLKSIFRVRYAVLTHSIDVWSLKAGIKYRGLKNADIITAVSRYTKMRLIGNGIDETKITLLQDAVDTSIFSKKEKNIELLHRLGADGKRILLTVGRMDQAERYKGHDIMLEVIKKLGEEYLWLVIGAGNDMPRLLKKAAEEAVSNKVIFLGPVTDEELIDYYNICDLFIMPSREEGFGIVYLEAMACGKPAIGGSKDGSVEPLLNGNLGFLIDPNNAEEIINAIHIACTTKEKRTDPAYLAEEVKRHFGIQAFNKRVKEVFDKTLS